MSVSTSSLLLNEDSSFAMLRPYSASLPDNINCHLWFEISGPRLSNPCLIVVRQRQSCIFCARCGHWQCMCNTWRRCIYARTQHSMLFVIVTLPRAVLSLSSVCLAGYVKLMELDVPTYCNPPLVLHPLYPGSLKVASVWHMLLRNNQS